MITGTAPPQPFVNKSFIPAAVTVGGTSILLLAMFAASSTPRTSTTLTTVFADNLPSGVLIVTPDALSTNCPNPVTTTASSGVVSYPGWRSGTGQWLLHFCQLGFCRFGAEVKYHLGRRAGNGAGQ